MRLVSRFSAFCLTAFIFLHIFAAANNKDGIVIGVFDTIPSQIDGGYCAFYKSVKDMRRGQFVLINDLANTAYLVVNHHLVEFTLLKYDNDVYYYANKKYRLKVQIMQSEPSSQDEFYSIKGFLIVEDHKNHRIKINFYGDCGW